MKRYVYLVILLISAGFAANAKVTLPSILTDNMVLQQKEKVNLWGKAAPNTKLTITTSWDNQKYSLQTGNEGNFEGTVNTPSYGGPYSISFDDGEVLTLKNVLIGEVWICSGQSNMQFAMREIGNQAEQEINAANFPNIRVLRLSMAASNVPMTEPKLDGGGWAVCSPQSIRDFSAVGYFFGRDLNQKLNVPIGLIESSWGGTISEAWTSGNTLKKFSEFQQVVKQMQSDNRTPDQILSDYTQAQKDWFTKVQSADAGFYDNKAVWAASDFNDVNWKNIELPGFWELSVLPSFDGVVWMRKKINIGSDFSPNDVVIHLEQIDDNDIVWFNGVEVGRTEGWNTNRTYKIPAKLIKNGENVITIRAFDTGGNGGVHGNAGGLKLVNSSDSIIQLGGTWKYRTAVNFAELPTPQLQNGPNRPTVLYNAMINPLTKVKLKGVIWYQGESNASRADQYRTIFPALIKDWRTQFNNPDLYFLYVQLANFMQRKNAPGDSEWAELRDAQLQTLKVPNTGMALAIDIGEAGDIHPKNKLDVGKRLALAALAKAYGQASIAYSGPIYKSFVKTGKEIVISFDHVNEGLKTRDGSPVKGFTIAGKDQKFRNATAVIKGNQVVVSAAEISEPVALRYAWADNPDCNLVNGAGLPASPFRTDNWKGITFGKK
ncbi:sialate O-acetylesterase [Pedobacter frigoris]|uniref:9-O-acetylesterase n=1 Tax=Pedobacter frigoris TaxID=2571272 RepID=A0A4U1CRL5_9SPHI|nr:sialate O-acetylesterase [Pedobacter frigoris]TKC09570.1 9-O-acetylesterase [Pedobacter frigoris]